MLPCDKSSYQQVYLCVPVLRDSQSAVYCSSHIVYSNPYSALLLQDSTWTKDVSLEFCSFAPVCYVAITLPIITLVKLKSDNSDSALVIQLVMMAGPGLYHLSDS